MPKVCNCLIISISDKIKSLTFQSGVKIVGSGGRNRTYYLQVMSLTSYHCSTPQRLLLHNIVRFLLNASAFLRFFSFLWLNRLSWGNSDTADIFRVFYNCCSEKSALMFRSVWLIRFSAILERRKVPKRLPGVYLRSFDGVVP